MASDLISRKAMLERLEKWNTSDCLDKAFYEFTKSRMIEQPTVDAAPVVHGEWLETSQDDKKRCSKCDVIHLIAQYPYGKANYCPNCGTKMDGGKE